MRSTPKRVSSSSQSRDGVPASFSKTSCSTVTLTCLSPDSSTIHTLSPTDGTITTYFLPLTELSPSSKHDTGSKISQPKGVLEPMPENQQRTHRVVTKLPDYMTQSFRLDPPLEFICVDNFLVDGTKKWNGRGRLPLLCAYNCRAAFVLDISYSTVTDQYSNGEAEGCVDEVIEPFETHLLSSKLTSVKIIRIRAAPQSCFLGGGVYETLNPRAAMVMLTDEHSLVVHHGIGSGLDVSNTPSKSSLSGGYVSVPLSIRTEEVEDGDPLVDFSFLPSSPKGITSVLNAMTVALTTRSGFIFLASPILFHGTVLPRKDVHASIAHLERELAQGPVDNPLVNSIEGATWRRNRAALQFLLDAFGSPTQSSQNSYYLTAKIFEGGARCGTAWPVSVQGPLCSSDLYDNEVEEEDDEEEEDYENIFPCRVSCMEAMVTSLSVGSLASVVLSGHRHSGHFVHFVMFPSAVLPRFAFESKNDADLLNDLMHNSAVVADKISIDIGHENYVDRDSTEKEFVIVSNTFLEDGRDISVVLDPVDKNMLHHVSRYGVFTIISDAFAVMSRKILSIMSENKFQPLHYANIKVNAWSSIDIALNDNGECVNGALSGAVIIGDAQYGHLLVATLTKDPSISVLNLSAAQYLQESNTEINAEKEIVNISKTANNSNDDALKTMESIAPLHEVIAPLFQKITMAVSNMSKVVGGSTFPKDISAGGVANFLEAKENSGHNIVFPLIELKGVVKARLKYLQDMRTNQEIQISQLMEQIEALKSHAKVQQEAVKSAELTSKMLINRSAKVLSTMRNKAPAITYAEREYFDQIRRCDVQCSKWSSLLDQMDSLSRALHERLDGSAYQLNLSTEQRIACNDLLDGQKVLLERNASALLKCGESIRGLVTESGIA